MGTPFRTLAPLLLLAVFLCTLTAHQPVVGADPSSAKPSVNSPPAAPGSRVAAALDKKVSLAFEEELILEISKKLSKMTGVPLECDEVVLSEAGLGKEVPFTIHVHDVSLRSALRLLLRPRSMTTVIYPGEVLLITSEEAANARLATRTFAVRDLIETPDDLGEIQEDYKTLIDIICSTVRPQSWDAVGGAGTITGLHGTLAVNQTGEVLEEIPELLTALRKVRQLQEKSPGGSAVRLGVSPAQEQATERFNKILAQPWTLEFKEQPLNEAMETIAKNFQFNVQFDDAALKEAGITLDTPVSFDLKDIPLRGVLQRILSPLHLTYFIWDEVLFVTTQSTNCFSEVTRLYPLADLVRFSDLLEIPDKGTASDTLIDSIETIVRSLSWDKAGGRGSIKVSVPAKVFVVFQSPEVHDELESFLGQLRAELREHPPANAAVVPKPVMPDQIVVKVYPLVPSTSGSYIPAADVAQIVKDAVGAKAWQGDGLFARPVERVVPAQEGAKDARGVTYPSLVVRQTVAVQRNIRRLLAELHVNYVPPEARLRQQQGASLGAAPTNKNLAGREDRRPTARELTDPDCQRDARTTHFPAGFVVNPLLGDAMPPPEKCEGTHGEPCPVPPAKLP